MLSRRQMHRCADASLKGPEITTKAGLLRSDIIDREIAVMVTRCNWASTSRGADLPWSAVPGAHVNLARRSCDRSYLLPGRAPGADDLRSSIFGKV
jgi:hypothetical protein